MVIGTRLTPPRKAIKRLFVISDLHIGGDYPDKSEAASRGFRICTHVDELVAFIRWVTTRARQESVDTELVINGDLVDFLAEKSDSRNPASGEIESGWHPFIGDPQEAEKIFRRIIDRDKMFFSALKDLLAAGNRLTITLGNHDIELSFPALRRMLIEELDADGKRFSFIYDGEAHQIGNVLIEHGNRYDEWNVVTHDALRRVRSVQSRMEPFLDAARGFEAPAGSFLVAGVMNEIKARYPFIDLLKPESEAAIPILLALAPEYRSRIVAIAKLIASSRIHVVGGDGLPSQAGDIAEVEGPLGREMSGEAVIRNILQARLGAAYMSEFASATHTEPGFGNIVQGESAAGDIQGGDLRTLWSILRLSFAAPSDPVIARLPILLAALEGTRGDFSFDRQREIAPYQSAAQRLLQRGFRLVLFGHTHLAKEMNLDGGTYINTGTWADILPFPETVLGPSFGQSQTEGDRCYAARIGRLSQFVEDMETARLDKYLRFVPTYAQIEFDPRGELIGANLYQFDAARRAG